MKILSSTRNIESVGLPNQVNGVLESYLTILEDNYGANRDIYKDLGGYAVIPESVTDVETIKQKIIKGTVPEDVEVIECGEGQIFCSSLFILSSDYAVIVVATKELTDLLLGE